MPIRRQLKVAARDLQGDVRAVELEGHPFYVATLFQPERAAIRGLTPPLARAFVTACLARAGTTSEGKHGSQQSGSGLRDRLA